MKRPLTDHEYQVNGGAWIGCTSSNTTNNGDGTYTITDGLNVAIPIGSLRVRVKSIGINPASSALQNTVAFNAPVSEDTPLFYINPVKTMAVGDADQLLGFVSSSAGAVTFVSSDTSKATIVVTGGNSYLHAVAEGDVTVTANQAANGSYSAATDNSLGTVVTATVVDDITYSTLAAGKAATSNGSKFNVADASGNTLRKYLMVAGKAVFQGVLPNTTLTTMKAVKEKIYSGALGTMPGSPIVDLDSTFAAYHINKFKNIGGVNALDFNIDQFPTFETVCDFGNITYTPISETSYRIDFAGAYSTSYAAFTRFFGGRYVPAGVWTLAMEIRLLPGDSGKSVYYGLNQDSSGASYSSLALMDTDQTLVYPAMENDTDTILANQLPLLGAATGGTPVTLSVIVSNIRFIPGTSGGVGSPLINDVVLFKGSDYIARGLNADLSFNFNNALYGTGNGMVTYPLAGGAVTIPECTVTYAFKMRHSDSYKGTGLLCDKGHNNFVLFGSDETITYSGNMFNGIRQSIAAYNMFGNKWVIMTLSYNGTTADFYINGIRVNQKSGSVGNIVSNFFVLLGADGGGFRTNADISAISMWASKLSDANIKTSVGIIKERMRLKNHFIDQSKLFYIAEGDSITDGTPIVYNTYQKLIRDTYLPLGASAAITGSTLGIPGDTLPTNSMYARKAWVTQTVLDAVSEGYNVVMSILIGANDIGAIGNSSDAITYYNNYMAYVADMRAAGAKVIVGTILDQAVLSNKTFLTQINTLLLSDATKYDGIADYHSDPNLTPATATYYVDAPNYVHPNDAGHVIIKDKLKAIIDTLI